MASIPEQIAALQQAVDDIKKTIETIPAGNQSLGKKMDAVIAAVEKLNPPEIGLKEIADVLGVKKSEKAEGEK